MKRFDRCGISAVPAAGNGTARVFLQLDHFYLNGRVVQSAGLSVDDVDRLIDDLIDAQRRAKALASTIVEGVVDDGSV